MDNRLGFLRVSSLFSSLVDSITPSCCGGDSEASASFFTISSSALCFFLARDVRGVLMLVLRSPFLDCFEREEDAVLSLSRLFLLGDIGGLVLKFSSTSRFRFMTFGGVAAGRHDELALESSTT